jgi:hypothetical protein
MQIVFILNVVMPSVIVQNVMALLFLLNNNISKVTKNVILLIKCCREVIKYQT